jgi:hypothetical protein
MTRLARGINCVLRGCDSFAGLSEKGIRHFLRDGKHGNIPE